MLRAVDCPVAHHSSLVGLGYTEDIILKEFIDGTEPTTLDAEMTKLVKEESAVNLVEGFRYVQNVHCVAYIECTYDRMN